MIQQYHMLQNWYLTRQSLTQSGPALKKRREKLWQSLQGALSKTPALAEYSGQAIADFPVVTPMDIRHDITHWNSVGIRHNDAHNAAAQAEAGGSGEVLPGIIAGYSTGTSGIRGLFLASQKERAIYLGQSAAKFIPLNSALHGVRIMLFLRANSRLYSDSRNSGLIRFCYQPLSSSPQEKLDVVRGFDPTILIAPSHVLLELARAGYRHKALTRCFYGAEPMGEAERLWITERIGIRPDPIYQATEGFLGSSCAHGKLHLNEDSFEFEFAPVKGTPGYQIIATDLLRDTQPIVRVKLDDYIELDHKPCPCGFAGRTILPVSGRVQNLWRFHDRIVTPQQVTSALEGVLGAARKWKAVGSYHSVQLQLENSISNDLAQHVAQTLAGSLGLDCPIEIEGIGNGEESPKRHRVIWRDIHGK